MICKSLPLFLGPWHSYMWYGTSLFFTVSHNIYPFYPKLLHLPDLLEEFSYMFYTCSINLPELKGQSPWCLFQKPLKHHNAWTISTIPCYAPVICNHCLPHLRGISGTTTFHPSQPCTACRDLLRIFALLLLMVNSTGYICVIPQAWHLLQRGRAWGWGDSKGHSPVH